MEVQRAARAFRAVRRERRLRQREVARRAGVSQQHVSDLERGLLGRMTLDDAARLFEALDIRAVLTVSWRGGELDRLLDEGHASVCRRVASVLREAGWVVVPEATYSHYGERGSIDLLAWHAPTRTLLVIEVKTEIASAEELLRRHDAKVRLAPRIARERFGQQPTHVARLLVLSDTMTNRRRVARLGALLDPTYPQRGDTVRRWLRSPSGPLAGLLFTDTALGGGSDRSRRGSRTTFPSATADGGI